MNRILFTLFVYSLSAISILAGHHIPQCGSTPDQGDFKYSIPSDCSEGHTVIKDEYNPGEVFRIPVVFHIVYHSDGSGRISEDRVREQIRHLNEDFRAIAGSKGEPGFDCGIEFYLADKDPSGNSTTGITFTENNRWYADEAPEARAEVGHALGWDPKKYLNIYTNEGYQAFGYITNWPWMGGANPDTEGVAIAYFVVGDNVDFGFTYSGQILTHEIGHYMGLMHTFGWGEGNCPTGNCYEDGDYICDTESQATANEECNDGTSCDSRDPIHNYMNYTPDSCSNKFTAEQGNRMRCALISYRSELIHQNGGSPAHDYTRWIPHITRSGGGFNTTMMIQNTSNSSETISLHPMDASGQEGSSVDVTLNAHEISIKKLTDLFTTQPSHIGLSGGDHCVVTIGYRDYQGAGATAHVPESKTATQSFSFYPGESTVFDGIALLNLGSSVCDVTLETLNTSGGVVTTKKLISGLAPKGKYLTTLDNLNLTSNEILVRITATQKVLPLVLRGSRPGTSPAFLFQTLPNLN